MVFVAVYSFDGLIVFGLLLICTCAYMSRVPRLKQWLLSEKKGFFGVFYKGKWLLLLLLLLPPPPSLLHPFNGLSSRRPTIGVKVLKARE